MSTRLLDNAVALMMIVAANLPYVAGKFGGSTRSRKPPSTTHASIDAEDGKELSTLLSR